MWDEVVMCYQLMQKPHRAELVVRECLKKGETPYMLTALADLTQVGNYTDTCTLRATQYSAQQCNTMQYKTVEYSTMQYNTK
jgi:hypothetical protein